MLRAMIGVIIGLMIGSIIPLITINTKILAVMIIVSADTLIGSLKSYLESNFNDIEMISGFIINSIVAVSLVFLGDYLIVSLYYLVLFALGIRIFENLSKIRQHLIKKL